MRRTLWLAVVAAVPALVPPTAGAQVRQAPRQSVEPVEVSPEQFQSLAWILGRWRGSGMGYSAFYEEYSLADDSTVVLRTYRDSTFTQITQSSTFEWRGGRLAHVEGRNNYVTRIAGDSVTFASGVLYLRLSDDLWRAVFAARAAGADRPFYELKRIGVRPPQ